jgi:hypothetical protein
MKFKQKALPIFISMSVVYMMMALPFLWSNQFSFKAVALLGWTFPIIHFLFYLASIYFSKIYSTLLTDVGFTACDPLGRRRLIEFSKVKSVKLSKYPISKFALLTMKDSRTKAYLPLWHERQSEFEAEALKRIDSNHPLKTFFEKMRND